MQSRGIDIYDEMLTDDQVYAISMTKKLIMLSPGWTVLPATESKRDIAIADFVKWNLVTLPGTFRNVLFNVLTAMDYGFSLSEKVWTLEKDNSKYSGLVKLKSIKPKSPKYFGFTMDGFGNLLGVNQNIGSPAKQPFDPDKFVIYSYNSKFSNPYGMADLRAAYLPWLEKKMIRRFWSIFLERFGSPLLYATIPRGSDQPTIDKIKLIMRNLQTKSSFTIPEGFVLNMLEASRAGHAGYEAAIAEKNISIAHAILMPDLLGFSSGESPGSLALGKAHVDIFLTILEKMTRDLEDDVVGEQIIRPLVDFNFKVNAYPVFKFDPMKQENRSIRAKMITLLIDAGVVRADEPWIRDWIEIPQPMGSATETEQEAINPPMMDKIDKILSILEGEPPSQLAKPTTRKVGTRAESLPGMEPTPGRSGVEVQEPGRTEPTVEDLEI